MSRKYRLVGPNIETEIIDVETGDPLDAITETAEEVQALIDQAPSGGLFGAKTVVVSTEGDDTAGAADPYAAEFLTIQAAITAAASGDCVVVRPGTYTQVASDLTDGGIVLKNGVNVFGMPGAIVTMAGGNKALFCDNGSSITARIMGHFRLVATGDSYGLRLGGNSRVDVECDEVDLTASTLPAIKTTSTSQANITFRVRGRLLTGRDVAQINSDSNSTISIWADTILAAGTGIVVSIPGGSPTVAVEAAQSIIAGQIVNDAASSGATRVSVKAPKITATDAGAFGLVVNHAGSGARYDIDADVIACGMDLRASAGEVHVRGKTITAHTNGQAAINVSSGKVFLRGDEWLGLAGGGACAPIRLQGGTTHVLSGRVVGADGDASGNAITFATDAAALRVYPGVVLIAGDTGAGSLGLAGAAATPTVIAMGDIAANKAAEAGVVIAVGSLLVDAAVV